MPEPYRRLEERNKPPHRQPLAHEVILGYIQVVIVIDEREGAYLPKHEQNRHDEGDANQRIPRARRRSSALFGRAGAHRFGAAFPGVPVRGRIDGFDDFRHLIRHARCFHQYPPLRPEREPPAAPMRAPSRARPLAAPTTPQAAPASTKAQPLRPQ